MNATFIVWFHTARKDNLLQTLHFLSEWHKEVAQECELITVCQNQLDFELPINHWKYHQHFDLGIPELHHAYVINFAVDKARFEKIIVLESDRILPKNYFKETIKQLKEGIQITTQTMKKLKNDVSNEEIESDKFEFQFEHRAMNNQTGMRNMWSGNTAFMKSDFIKAGRIDEEYVGYGWTDTDMCLTMKKAGIKSFFKDEIELHLWHPALTYGKADQKKQFIDNGIKFCGKWKQPYPQFLIQDIISHEKKEKNKPPPPIRLLTNPIVVYQWWGEKNEQPAYSNLAHPVILSIATLRAVNPTIPITIMNCSKYSKDDHDWSCFKEKLNFNVIQVDAYLEKNYSNVAGYKLLSRLFDIKRHFNQPVIYCDSDVFWFKDPMPLSGDSNKFCFDGYNSGFFYYDPSSPIVEQMFELFESYTITCLRDEKFCNTVKEKISFDNNSWQYIWDEKILHYIKWQYPELFSVTPQDEHGLFRYLKETINPKMLHCNGLIVSNPIAKRRQEKFYCRGLLCLLFTEFYNNMCKVLDQKEIEMIFTYSEYDHYVPQQFSLLENIDRIEATKVDEWNCDIQKTLIQPKLEIP